MRELKERNLKEKHIEETLQQEIENDQKRAKAKAALEKVHFFGKKINYRSTREKFKGFDF